MWGGRMKKRFTFMMIVLVILLTGCSENLKTEEMPDEMPEDFGFSLFYGINGARHIDTFHGEVTKDWLTEEKEVAHFELTQEEKKAIYLKMKEVNVLKDFNIQNEESCSIGAERYTHWEIVMNQKVTVIQYQEYCEEVPEDVQKLMDIERYVHELVSSKEAYQTLPEVGDPYE